MTRITRFLPSRLVLAALALSLFISAPACGGGDGGADVEPGVIKIKLRDNSFDPNAITVKVGEEVTFQLTNVGKLVHNMRIAPANGNFEGSQSVVSTPEFIGASKTGTLKWTPAAAGTYRFRCDIHPIEQVGVITVE